MCHCRLSVLNPKYRALLKEGALTMDEVVALPDSRILVPCGKCSACRRQKALTWRGRLLREFDDYLNSLGITPRDNYLDLPVYFVTLTVSDKWRALVEDSPSACMRWFFEDIRALNNNKSLRHWFIVEYGDYKKYTGRIHFHGIFFGLGSLTYAQIRRCWRFGKRVDISRVRSRACMTYVTKYITKGNNHALVQAATGRFPHLSKIYSSAGIGSSLYTDSFSSIAKSASLLGPVTVSYMNFKFAVPYYYMRRAMDKVSPHLAEQRRILNSFIRQFCGWLNFFGIKIPSVNFNPNAMFADGVRYLPARLRRYAHLALLESNPSPPSIDFARRQVKQLLKLFSLYEYDHLRPPGFLSEIQCALRAV